MTTMTRRSSGVTGNSNSVNLNLNQLIQIESHENFKRKHLSQNKEIISKNSELTKTNTLLQKQIATLRNESLTLKHSNLTLKHSVFSLECMITGLQDRAERAEQRVQELESRPMHTPRDNTQDQAIRQTLLNTIEALQSIHSVFSAQPYATSPTLDHSSSRSSGSVSPVASTSAPSIPNNVSVSRRHSSAARAARPSISTRPDLSYISEGEGSTEREDEPELVREWAGERHILEGLHEIEEPISRRQSMSSSPLPHPSSASPPYSFESSPPSSPTPPVIVAKSPSPPPILTKPIRSTANRLPPTAPSASTSATIALNINKARPTRRVSGLLRPTNINSSPSELDSVSSPSSTATSASTLSSSNSSSTILPASLTRNSRVSIGGQEEATPTESVKGKERERTGLVASMLASRTSLGGASTSSVLSTSSTLALVTKLKPRKSTRESSSGGTAAPTRESELWVKRRKVLESSSEDEDEGQAAEEEEEVIVAPAPAAEESVDEDGGAEESEAESEDEEVVDSDDSDYAAPMPPPPPPAKKVMPKAVPFTPAVPRSRAQLSDNVVAKQRSRTSSVVEAKEDLRVVARASSVPVQSAADDENLNPLGEGRRARKSVNYALPKLNTKMRQPEGYIATIKSTPAIASSSATSSSSAAPRKSSYALSSRSKSTVSVPTDAASSFASFQQETKSRREAVVESARKVAIEAAEEDEEEDEEEEEEESVDPLPVARSTIRGVEAKRTTAVIVDMWSQEANLAAAYQAKRIGRRQSAAV